eukprot:5829322-Alexandrium_andersonii.AAC.1
MLLNLGSPVSRRKPLRNHKGLRLPQDIKESNLWRPQNDTDRGMDVEARVKPQADSLDPREELARSKGEVPG